MALLIRFILFALIAYWIFKTLKKHFRTLDHSQQAPNEFESNAPKDPYQILDIGKNSTQDEIKKAYKQALAQYHPDKVAHLGADIKNVAQRKTQQIQWAYEKLKK